MSNDDYQIIEVPDGVDPSSVLPQQTQQNYSVPMQAKGDRADLIDKIKPDYVIEAIRLRLLGKEFKNGVWVANPALSKKRLTEEGASELANLMMSVCHISMSTSKLNDREIKERLKRIARTAQFLAVSNWREYGIKNTSQFHFIHEIVFSNALAVLKQADGAIIQELLKATVYENRMYTDRPKESRSNKLKRLVGLGG